MDVHGAYYQWQSYRDDSVMGVSQVISSKFAIKLRYFLHNHRPPLLRKRNENRVFHFLWQTNDGIPQGSFNDSLCWWILWPLQRFILWSA